ncbi:MAG: MerC domain-containing protein [Proteobacteria bacterium]|nr:MerC domain-containing protein [Pseudomonadota bacterium]MDA1332373.1 MerC domain-containing protein [Pseudomonadota bacterium]
MRSIQAITDRTSIGLSLVCAVHCLFVPVLLVAVPSLASLPLDNEAFHAWMLVAVLPISIFALTLGCKKHKQYKILALGLLGLSSLVSALLFESLVGETGEKLLTLLGAGLIAWGHLTNFRLCQQHDKPTCVAC